MGNKEALIRLAFSSLQVLELIEVDYLIKRFLSFWMWLLSRVSEGDESYNFPVIGNLEHCFDFVFVEVAYPA